MSYTALYRKFRPDNFQDVKGQDHIVTTLKNQIVANRIGHAYLFTGIRGTGKTTLAKIFAKAVNCEDLQNGSPCGKCSLCKEISAGASMNVIEIDAASNNGVDNVREIVEEVEYSPTKGKYKVYIIDEAHMITVNAFNALLKTLEEPPSYVIFILATTEVNKIPITILSRCQRYNLHRITPDIIQQRLQELMLLEGEKVEEKALKYIARKADGAMRDALSLLDQCIAFHIGEELTYDKVMEVLGAVDIEVFSRLLNNIVKNDLVGALSLLDEIIMDGRDLTQFINDFIWYLRNLMLLKATENTESMIELSKEQIEHIQTEAQKLHMEQIIRYIRIFAELVVQIKATEAKRVYVEMAFVKLCKPSMEVDQGSMLERMRLIEEQLENGVVQTVVQAADRNPEKLPKEPLPSAVPEDIKIVLKRWNDVIAYTANPMKTILKRGQIGMNSQDELVLMYDEPVAYSYFADNEEKREELKNIFRELIKKEVNIQIELENNKTENSAQFWDIAQLGINMDIEVEDE